VFADQVGNTMHQYSGLPRTGAGEDEQRPARMGDGFALWWIEIGEQIQDGLVDFCK